MTAGKLHLGLVMAAPAKVGANILDFFRNFLAQALGRTGRLALRTSVGRRMRNFFDGEFFFGLPIFRALLLGGFPSGFAFAGVLLGSVSTMLSLGRYHPLSPATHESSLQVGQLGVTRRQLGVTRRQLGVTRREVRA
jgi:hypothetical protein